MKKAKKEISIQEKLGDKIPFNLTFKDENGKEVKIKDYFQNPKKPVILTPVYYTCPHLCTLIFKGLKDAINEETKYQLGKDYQILSISMKHEEVPQQAKARKDEIMKKIDLYQNNQNNKDNKNTRARKGEKYKKQWEQGWSFLTGTQENIKKVYKAVGFRYKRDGEEYAHTATIIFLTPQGEVARYLYGILYKKNDFRLSILESLKGKISSFTEQIFFYCFRYNSAKRVYSLIAWRVMTIGSIITVILLFGLLLTLWLKEHLVKK